MRRLFLFFFLLLLISLSGFISASSVGLIENETWQGNFVNEYSYNGAAYGDIDNDGDLDIVSISGTGKPYIYINNGTSFVNNTNWEQNLNDSGSGSLALGDIDNDGYLDLVISGSINPWTQIYINNGTSLNSNATWQNLVTGEDGAASSSVALGDIDNDGDLDLVFPGMSETSQRIVFINNGTTFVNDSVWGQEITDRSKISTGLVDLDNDGYLDLGILGDDSGFYINNGTSFIYTLSWYPASSDEANVGWGDFDNDGDFDYGISQGISGVDFAINNGSYCWRNDSWNSGVGALYWGSMMFGDYDNNGYLDLVHSGMGGGYQIKIASNNGITFDLDYTAGANLTAPVKSSNLWGDVDNDGDLDLIVVGNHKVYISNASLTNPNEEPTAPTEFSYLYENREIKLGWINGSDNETISTGLYYNMKLGISANNHSIISGVYGGAGDAVSGGTAFGYYGNMMQRKNFTLKVDRLQPSTTYYWYVQTIDTGLKAGNWSTVQSFTTSADLTRPTITLNSPVANTNSSSHNLVFNTTAHDNINLTTVSLWGSWGEWHLNETNSSGINNTDYIFTVNLTGYSDGDYTWMIQAGDNETNVENSSIRTFTLDTTAPNITSEVKTPSIVYTNNDSTLNATITDALVGLDTVWISVNATGSFVNYTVISPTSTYSFTLISGNYSKNTNVSWRYYANDSAGNEQTGDLQSFVIANSPPILTGVPDNSTNEDTTPPNRFYNLSSYSSDADSDGLTFYIQSQSNSSLINCLISESSYINCSTPSANQSGSSTIVVNVTDGTSWANDSFIITVINVNDIPWVSLINLTAQDSNKTNETLTGAYTFNDVESPTETLNETKWYRNSSEVVSLANLTSISSGNTTKGENWTFSTRVYDGTNWSSWYNSSNLTIQNSPPDFSTISNQSWVMNSNLTLNLSQYFTDIDGDSLTYTNTSVENVTVDINQTTGVVVLAPETDWNGTRYIVFNASDSEAVVSNNITLEVFKPQFNYSGFDGATTNFTNLTEFVDVAVVIEKATSGKMSFDSVTLNDTFINISEYVIIGSNSISLNASALPELNVSATLSLYGLSYTNPRPLKDGVVCSDCVEVSYSGGVFVFSVAGFSVYSAGETPVETVNTGGSSGGGGGSSTKTYSPTEAQLKEGYTNSLAKGDKMNFNLGEENHSLEIKNIVGDLVNITLNSNPINFILGIGEERRFDLDNNSIYDLLVRLNSVVSGKANLTIREIDEGVGFVVEGEDVEIGESVGDESIGEDEVEKDLTWLWVVGVIVMVVVMILIKRRVWKKWQK